MSKSAKMLTTDHATRDFLDHDTDDSATKPYPRNYATKLLRRNIDE